MIQTKRVYLKEWEVAVAKDLYEIAKNEKIGPSAGWPAHKNIEESENIIKTVLATPETKAIYLKENDKLIGSIGVRGILSNSELTKNDKEIEIGYWLSEEVWGQGIMPEVVSELIKYFFEEKGFIKIYAGYYEGNDKSKRVMEKCGLRYEYTIKNKEIKLLNKTTDLHVTSITVDEWKAK